MLECGKIFDKKLFSNLQFAFKEKRMYNGISKNITKNLLSNDYK